MAFAWLGATLLLSGCAAGPASPALRTTADLRSDPARLKVDVASLRLQPLETRRIDPARALDPTDVAILAVLNSPDLEAKRAAARVAAAQTFAAGLLPDPQLVLTTDIPVHPAGLVTAYNVNPTFDLVGLITHSTALRAARAAGRQADLDLLWAEWGVAQQARQLAITVLADEAKSRVLREVADGSDARYRASNAAMKRGDVTSVVASADLAADLDARAQLASALRDAEKARADLDALLGLTPDTPLDLVDGAAPTDLTDAETLASVEALPDRRPDLLALQRGYDSQNAVLRRALLARFPLINIGCSRQSDTGGIITNGATATLTLPIFNRGRGDIGVQTATRERLLAEYRARIDQAVADAAGLRRELSAARAGLAAVEARIPALAEVADHARAALLHGDLDSAAYLALQQSVLKQRVAALDLKLAIASADVTLRTVLYLSSRQGPQS